MNENVKKLAEEATRKYDRLGNEIPFSQPDLELFAQLIVCECIRLCDQVDIVGADDCIYNIKQHFEIE